MFKEVSNAFLNSSASNAFLNSSAFLKKEENLNE
jgi:hypothetical protein